MRRFIFVAIALLAASGGLRAPALAQDYLPLVIGNTWRYQGVEGHSETQVVTGTQVVWGTPTYVIDYQNSSSNEGLENYWTTEGSGDVLLWGWWRDLEGLGLLWQPPILAVDAPLFLGKTWTITTTAYALPDTSFFGTFEITLEVVEAGVIAVPAGPFFAYGIEAGPAVFTLSGGAFGLDGVAARTVLGSGPDDWYSDGVGEVQYDADDLYQLVSFNLPTSNENTSWGGIKGLYR